MVLCSLIFLYLTSCAGKVVVVAGDSWERKPSDNGAGSSTVHQKNNNAEVQQLRQQITLTETVLAVQHSTLCSRKKAKDAETSRGASLNLKEI